MISDSGEQILASQTTSNQVNSKQPSKQPNNQAKNKQPKNQAKAQAKQQTTKHIKKQTIIVEHSGRLLQHSELVLELSGASQDRSASFLAQQKSRARTTSNSRAQHDNRARKKHTNRARARARARCPTPGGARGSRFGSVLGPTVRGAREALASESDGYCNFFLR